MLQWIRRLFGDQRPTVQPVSIEDQLLAISNAKTIRDVPELFKQIDSPVPSLQQAARAQISEILGRSNVNELFQLDQTIRSWRYWHPKFSSSNEIALVASSDVEIAGLLSFHASGFVREEAVKALDRMSVDRAVPYLIIRLNDWVEAVRAQATWAIGRRIDIKDAGAFFDALPLLQRLQHQKRASHEQFLQSIINLILNEISFERFEEKVRDEDRQTRRFAFHLLMESPHGARLDDIQRIVLRSRDNVIQQRGAQRLIKEVEPGKLKEMLAQFEASKRTALRREAMLGRVERLPSEIDTTLRAALFDPHRLIRELARSFLRSRGETDLATFYRDAISTGAIDPSIALLGLGETGGQADVPFFASYLDHSQSKLRRAAIIALTPHRDDAIDQRIWMKLNDPAPCVAKAAQNAILKRRYLLSTERIESLFESTSFRHTQSLLLNLSYLLNWWERTPFLIRASARPDTRPKALNLLNLSTLRGGRFSVRPTANQLESLAVAFGRYKSQLNPELRKDIQSALDEFTSR